MARIFIEGFEGCDGGSIDGWQKNQGVAGLATINASTGLSMSGDKVLRCNGYGVSTRKTLVSSLTEAYFAFKIRPYNDNANHLFGLKDSGATTILSITRNGSKLLEVRRGDEDSTVLLTGAISIEANTTYLIELHYIPLNSGGTVELKVDEVSDGTYSGDTTAGLENIKYVSLGGDGSNHYVNTYYDDLVIDDADWVGATKIQAQLVTGAGTTTEWDPSTGSNYECVNEVPYGDADYVATDTIGEIDTYAVADLADPASAIKCIQVTTRAAYAGSTTPTKITGVVRPASTNRVHGVPVSTGIGMTRHDFLWELNPDDSAAFEQDDVNGMEIGVEAVA